MTSSGAAPSCRPMARSCVASGSRFAAHGRNSCGGTRRGDSGILSEMGKAPRAVSHCGRVGEARPLGVHLDGADDAAFVIDRQAQPRAVVLGFGEVVDEVGQQGVVGVVVGRHQIESPEADGGRHDQCASELTARLAGLELEDEAATDARRQGEIVLAHLQGFAVLADHGAKLLSVGAG